MGDLLDLPAGRVLGRRYRIERRLAAGGMAAVFEATIVDLGRRVAVKTLHPHLGGDGRSVERLRREALAVAGLQHPNIVQVLDFQAAPGEPVFLVMELLEGRTLFDLVQQAGPLPWPRVAALGRQLLSGLGTAHASGILHRDLKPANVFVVPLAGGELVKLLDFGLAAVREGPGFEKLTRTGVVLGTPAYMAPEQARGDRVDVRADVYGVGTVLYFALTGRRPFEARTAGEVLVQVIGQNPPAVSDLRPDLPPGVAAVVARAMAKRPDDRFSDVAALAEALVAAEAAGTAGTSVPPRASQQVVPSGSQPGDVPTSYAPSLHVSAPPSVAVHPPPAEFRGGGPPQLAPRPVGPPAPGAGPAPAGRARWKPLVAGGAGAILAGVAVALVVWAASRGSGDAGSGAPASAAAGGAESSLPAARPACARPAPGEPRSEFSTDVRVLLCDRCLAPVETPAAGGEVTCDRCGTVNILPSRDDRTPLAPAERAAISEAERLSLLQAAEDEPWLPPESIAMLFVGEEIPDWRLPAAMAAWGQARREARGTGSPDAGERLTFLTLMLGTRYGRTGETRLKRGLYESALEVSRTPQDRQALRGALARAAALDGDTCSAEVWLEPCDSQAHDLESDSQWRVSRAMVDTVRHDWAAVLEVLGRTADEIPIREKVHTLAAVLRANAWERLGRVELAVELLRQETAYRPDALATIREGQAYYAPLRLCARSLAQLDPSPAPVAVPAPVADANGEVVADAAGEAVGTAVHDAGPTDAGPSEVAEAGVAAPDAPAAPLRGDAGGAGRRDATSAGDPGAGEGGPRVRVLSVEGRADEVNYFAMLAQTRTQTPRLARGCGLPATWRGTVIIVFSHLRGASVGSADIDPTSAAGSEVWDFTACVRDGLLDFADRAGGTGGEITVRFTVE